MVTFRLSKIWHTVNKYLAIVNAFLYGLGTFQVMDLKQIQERRVPLFWNILLLACFLLLLFIMIYGEYRRVEDLP